MSRVNLANALFRLGRFEQAGQQYQRCLLSDPTQQTALFGLAQTQITLKQYDQAQKTLLYLLEQDRKDFQAWLVHGDVAEKLGKRKTALNSWQQAAQDLSPVAIQRQAQERLKQYLP